MPALSALIDAELLQGCGAPGPDHACEALVRRCSTRFQEDELRQAAAASNGDPIPRPLSLCLRFPPGAGPRGTSEAGCAATPARRGAGYLARLYRETAMAATLFDRDRQVERVHFAGSTLGFLAPGQIAEALDVLARHFAFAPGPRLACSIELDPGSDGLDGIRQLAEAGFDRARLSVRDTGPTAAWLEACRQHGFRRVQLDFACDALAQTPEGPAPRLDALLHARPDQVSLHGPAAPPRRDARGGAAALPLPLPARRLALLRCAVDRLDRAGYLHLGMYCFVLPGDELALAREQGRLRCDAMGYTAHPGSDLVGLGLGAVSHVGAGLSQNPRDLPSWEQAIDQGHLPVWRGLRLDEDDLLRIELARQLLCQGEIDFETAHRRHAVDVPDRFADALRRLQPLAGRGLVELRPQGIRATPRGRLALPLLVACFDGRPAEGDARPLSLPAS